MAVSITSAKTSPLGTTVPGVWGPLKYSVTNILWDTTTYSTGGLAISNTQLQLPNGVIFSQAEQNAMSTATVTGGVGGAFYNTSTGKLQLFNSGNQEVANGTTLTGLGFSLIAWGY